MMDAHNIHPDKKLAASGWCFVCGGERDRRSQTGWGSYHHTDKDEGDMSHCTEHQLQT